MIPIIETKKVKRMRNSIEYLFDNKIQFKKNLLYFENEDLITVSDKYKNQDHTNKAFSEKWQELDKGEELGKFEKMQLEWYLKLYGFESNDTFSEFLKTKKIILDAGCGLGYKAAWFARLAPESIVIGIDYSEAAIIAANNYEHIPNLFFLKADIARTQMKSNSIDYVSCDQVIHHTEFPRKTFDHLSDITSKGGEFACYVYAKKALPRELLDDYFREYSKKLSHAELWDLSEKLMELGEITF